MYKRLWIGLIIAVIVIGSASQLSSAQDTPSRPMRDRDTGQLPIGHAPETAADQVQTQSIPAAPLSVTGVADWSRLTYQSYIGSWDIFAANGDGTNAMRLTSAGEADVTPRFNRGATRIAYASREPGNYEIYTFNPNGSGRVRVTNHSANDYNPAWSPDGSKIVFNSYRDGQSEIYVMAANGTNPVRLTYDVGYDGQPAWSPDGTQIAFLSDRSGSGQIWVMGADGHGPSQLTALNYAESPTWSPDGRHLAFDADSDGDGWQELLVMDANGSNLRLLGDTGTTADMWARSWSPDGRAVAFTAIYYVYYYGNWYWTAAYSVAADTVAGGAYSLGGSDTDWYPDWQTTDLLAPTSSLTALPATSASPFMVQWSGADAGPAGILGYDVQVKDGSGAWTMWLTRTVQTSGSYPGVGGHTYSFRVRAVDNSSNLQAWPVNAQASTTVEALPPLSTINSLPAYQRGELPLSWGGSDPGGSGIQTYDVQYRDGITGTWMNWQSNTALTTVAFSGDVGHAYSFRVRATDRAQNVGDWTVSANAQTTTFYLRSIDGMAFDTRGKPVVDASLIITPAALNSITSTARGYIGYLIHDDLYTVTAQQAGFGATPPLTLALSHDVTSDHWLPPNDNIVQNGDFENVPLTTTWQLSGNPIPVDTSVSQHSGSMAATLGTSFRFASPQNGWSNEYTAVDTDNNGTTHLVDIVAVNGGTQYEVRYSQKPLSVKTFTSPAPMLTTQSGWFTVSDPVIIADNQGGIHFVGRYYTATGVAYIFYCYKPGNAATCTTPLVLGLFYGAAFQVPPAQLALDRHGGLHVAWISGSLKYAYRLPNGVWTPMETISGVVANATGLAVDNQDIVHVVWEEWLNVDRVSMYRAKPLSGNWGPTIAQESTAGICNYQLAAAPDGSLHILRYTGNAVVYSRQLPDGNWSASVTFPTNGYYCIGGRLTFDADSNPIVITANEPQLWYHYLDDEDRWHSLAAGAIGRPQWFFAESDPIGDVNVLWTLIGESTFRYAITDRAADSADSDLTQVITIPGNLERATASVLYQVPDQLEPGNRLQLIIADTVSTTVVASATSPGNRWQQLWADVSHWAGQTITLTITWHQESGRPFSHVYVDEVSLGSWLTPDPHAITPSRIKVPASQVISITGDNFILTPQVRLNDVPLPDVTWIDTTTLTATVPVLPFGRYDLIVTNPGGQASGLPRALLVGYEVMLPIVRK